MIPDVFDGKIGGEQIDWEDFEPEDTDDGELAKTPSDVIEILGFDPLESEQT